LAASRVLLLAHYPSDMIGGLAIGAAIDGTVVTLVPALKGESE
jgi:membrane-associated phospholipid phosphatase